MIMKINVNDKLSFYPELTKCICEYMWGNLDRSFRTACKTGDIKQAQFLLEVNPTILITSKKNKGFKIACRFGHLNIAKWIYRLKPEIDISEKNEILYVRVCSSGKLEIVKWFYELKSDWKEYSMAFGCCCNYGELETARYLLSKHPTLNFSLFDELPFRVACEKGLFEMAKWLIEMKPSIDVRAKEDYAFTNSTNINIVEWLTSLFPSIYNVECLNGEIVSRSIISTE